MLLRRSGFPTRVRAEIKKTDSSRAFGKSGGAFCGPFGLREPESYTSRLCSFRNLVKDAQWQALDASTRANMPWVSCSEPVCTRVSKPLRRTHKASFAPCRSASLQSCPALRSFLQSSAPQASDHKARTLQLPLCTGKQAQRSNKCRQRANVALQAAAAANQRAAPDVVSASASVHPFPFTLQHLVTFQAVACADCIDVAAEHLGLSKRSVHGQLAKLEETVGPFIHEPFFFGCSIWFTLMCRL